MRETVIVEAVRTAVGKRNGGLSGMHAADLSAVVLNELLQRAEELTIRSLKGGYGPTLQTNAQLASLSHITPVPPAFCRIAFSKPSRCSTHFQISATTTGESSTG